MMGATGANVVFKPRRPEAFDEPLVGLTRLFVDPCPPNMA